MEEYTRRYLDRRTQRSAASESSPAAPTAPGDAFTRRYLARRSALRTEGAETERSYTQRYLSRRTGRDTGSETAPIPENATSAPKPERAPLTPPPARTQTRETTDSGHAHSAGSFAPASALQSYASPQSTLSLAQEAYQQEMRRRAANSRAIKALSGALDTAAAGYVNAAGTLLDLTQRYNIGAQYTTTEDWIAAVERAQEAPSWEAVDALHGKADALRARGAQSIEAAKDGLGGVGRTLVDVGVSGTQMLADAALSAIVPGAGLASMGVRSFGGAAQEARQRGADVARQAGYGAAAAGVELLSEKLFDGLAGVYGAGAADDIVEGVITKLTQSEGGRRALRLLSSGVGEAAEEVISGAVEPALEAILDGKTGYGRDTAAALAQSALVGGILGALGGGVQLVKDAASGTQTDAPVRETTEAAAKNETAASGTETAEEAIRVGKATTIYHPYTGALPIQTNYSEKTVTVPGVALEAAQANIREAQASAAQNGGRGFKTFLTRLCQQTFQRSAGVAVAGMSFAGTPYLVEIGNKVPGKVVSDRNLSAEKIALLDMLPQLVYAGRYVGSGECIGDQNKKNVIRYDYFETPVYINGKPYIARFDVEVLPVANNYRTHQITSVDLLATEAKLAGPSADAFLR